MKNISILFLFVFAISSCSLQQMQKLASEQQLTVKPSPLEMHGDSVTFVVDALLPVKMLRPKTSYTLNLTYQADGGSPMKVGEIVFLGDNFPNKEENPKISQRFSFPYKSSLKKGALFIDGSIAKGTSNLATDRMQIARGIITTAELVQPNFYSMSIPSGFTNPDEFESKNFDFFFTAGSSILRRSEKRGEQGKMLEDFILNYSKNLKSVSLTGMHSPEGATEINSKLAQGRPETIKKYFTFLSEKFQYDPTAINAEAQIQPIREDWTPLKNLLGENNSLSDRDKEQILGVINGPGDFVTKERSLRKLPSYRKMFRTIYPTLRNAKLEITRIKEKLSNEEILVYAKQIAKGQKQSTSLTETQMYYAADLTPNLDERLSIYEAYVKNFEEHKAEVYNNIGEIYLRKARQQEVDSQEFKDLLTKATSPLEESIKIKPLDEAYLNMAGINLMMGDMAKMQENIQKIMSSTNQKIKDYGNALMGYIYVKEARYSQAVQAYSGVEDATTLYNKALAILLKSSFEMRDDQYGRALKAFEKAITVDQNHALSYYAAAIAAARSKNMAVMLTQLKKAISIDKNLKQRAVTDYEFLSYFENAEFKKLFM